MRHQRFACAHLSHPYLTCSTSRLLTMTFTTAAFDRSSSWRFEALPYRMAPKGPPSSLVQHGALAPSLHNTTTALDRRSLRWFGACSCSRLRGTYPHLLHSIAPPSVPS